MNESHTSGQFRKCKQTQKVQLKPHFNINNKNIPPIVASQMNCCASRNSVNEKFTLPYMVELEKNCFFLFSLPVGAGGFVLAGQRFKQVEHHLGITKTKESRSLVKSRTHLRERETLSLSHRGRPQKNKHKNFFFFSSSKRQLGHVCFFFRPHRRRHFFFLTICSFCFSTKQ